MAWKFEFGSKIKLCTYFYQLKTTVKVVVCMGEEENLYFGEFTEKKTRLDCDKKEEEKNIKNSYFFFFV